MQRDLSEGAILNYLHEKSYVPGIVRTQAYAKSKDKHGNSIKTTDAQGETREHRVLLYADLGKSLVECESVYQFLRVMHDALAGEFVE